MGAGAGSGVGAGIRKLAVFQDLLLIVMRPP